MKKLILVSFAALALLASCKSNKNLVNAQAVAEEEKEEVSTFQMSEPEAPSTSTYKPTTTTNTSTSTSTYKPSTSTSTSSYTPSANVRTQSEEFAFDSANDASLSSNNSYFIIVGSFSTIANANRFKAELAPKGFSAIVLHSDTGYYRVCVNSYANENAARVRISQIRSEFPEYADCWLLVKK
ncbi:MAG: SPOR domain-containing protein [Mangrovibacterium sp.]